MSVAAVSLIKDEIDIVATTVGRMCEQCDIVYVADNGSSDGTREVLESMPVVLVHDREPGHYQSRKITALAARAREDGMDWVVPFDADEIWLANTSGRIADALDELPPEAMIADAPIFDHVATNGQVMSPWRRAAMLGLRKVACRNVEGLIIHDGNHGATFGTVMYPLVASGVLEVRHFPYRSAEHMIAKARKGSAAMAATDLPEHIGKHWRDYGRLSDDQIRETFYGHFFSNDPAADGLVRDPVPDRAVPR